MGKSLQIRMTVLGVEAEAVSVSATMTKHEDPSKDQKEEKDIPISGSLSGGAGVPMGGSLRVPVGGDEYTFTISQDGAQIAQQVITGTALRTHAAVTQTLRTQGHMNVAGGDVLLRVPISDLPGAALACGVDFALGAVGGDEEKPVKTKSKLNECCLYLGAHGILATRGASTDSFCRVLLVTEGEVEHEIGRTETVMDDLTPEWRRTIRFTYSEEVVVHLADAFVRVEICDPQPAAYSDDPFTVMGAAQLTLSDLHMLLMEQKPATPEAPVTELTAKELPAASGGITQLNGTPSGALLLSMALHQKAELQGILPPRKKVLKGKDKKAEKLRKSLTSSRLSLDEFKEEGAKEKLIKKTEKKIEKLEKKVSVFDAPATPKSSAKKIQGSRNLGTVMCAFELVKTFGDTKKAYNLVISGQKLKANHCAIKKVDPYIRVFRKLATSLSPKDAQVIAGGPWAPSRACVLKTPHLKSTRAPAWGVELSQEEILLPEQMLNNLAAPEDAELIFEAWDHQSASKDRLIGSCTFTFKDLASGKRSQKLKPPHWFHGRQDMIDFLTCCVGLGPSGAPGSLNVELKPATDLALSTHYKAFSCDEIHEKLTGKVSKVEGVPYTPLAERMRLYRESINTGEEVTKKSFWAVFSRAYRNFGVWYDNSTADWARGIKANAPFYQSTLRIGAEFGGALKAYFKFFYALVTLNLALFIVQFPVWIPQVLFVPGLNPIAEVLSSLTAKTGAALNLTASDDVASGETALLISTAGLEGANPEPGIFYFDAYRPFVPMNSRGDLYPVGVMYLLCGFVCLFVSLAWTVIMLRRKIRRPDAAVSAASPVGPGTADVLTGIFGMWDHALGHSADATKKTRFEIITRIKEGEAEAERAAEATSVVRSLSERRIIFLKRIVLQFLALTISAAGVAAIGACIEPTGKRLIDEYLSFVPGASSLIVTGVNAVVPALLKILVKLENYASPAVTLRQTTFRIFAIKIVNSMTIYFNLGIGDKTKPCPEKDAGTTMMQLLLIDAVVQSISFFLPKWIQTSAVPRIQAMLKPKKKIKKPKSNAVDPVTAPEDPAKKRDPKELTEDAPLPPPSPSPSPPEDVSRGRVSPGGSAVKPQSLPAPAPAQLVDPKPVPTPPPSPPEEEDEGKAWQDWVSSKKRKTPESMKDKKPFAPEEEEEEPQGKYSEEEEAKMFAKWQNTRRRPETIPTAEEEEEEEAELIVKPVDAPLIGHENPGAPAFNIPIEITKILYRQMLLFIGMLISPFIFGLGLLSTLLQYWVQYYTAVNLMKRPKEVSEFFAAGNTQRDFYIACLITTAFAFYPFMLFSLSPANAVCGPLRTLDCANGMASGNVTACLADVDRKNYDFLVETFLPAPAPLEEPVLALAQNASAVVEPPTCEGACIADRAKVVFSYVVATEVLMPVALIFLIATLFTTAVWARASGELKEAQRELAIEYKDKKMLARYANVEI